MKRPIILLLGTIGYLLSATDLPKLRVEGNKVMAGKDEIRLRGINWGWWNSKGTCYTESDMKRQAEWGANVLRLTINCKDLIDKNGTWSEECVAGIDEVAGWAEKYGQYIILDMHEVPGGQTPIHYCNGGKNAFWKKAEYQNQYIELWRRLAHRYRNKSVLGAYELMNEPLTEPLNPKLTADIQRRAIRAIREIDPDKIIVVTGDEMSSYKTSLTDAVKQDDPNILYTIHFYPGAFSSWLGNIGENRGVSGTHDWFYFELPVTMLTDADNLEFSMLLRSADNTGTAWFDDVAMTDDSGKIIYSSGFNKGTDSFSVERRPYGNLRHDPEVGHDRPGSLRIDGTDSYNSWASPRWKAIPGKTYKLSGWIKLDKGTGSTYIGAALFGVWQPDIAKLRTALKPAAAFAKKHNVPIFVGEFGMIRSSGPEGFQASAAADRIQALEETGFHWTYWNFHETTNPGTMALQAQKKNGENYPVNQPLLKVLKEAWKKNARRTPPAAETDLQHKMRRLQ